jgi:hypothetical protein
VRCASPIKAEQLVFIPTAPRALKAKNSTLALVYANIKAASLQHLPVINCGRTPGGAAPPAAHLRPLERRLGDLQVAVRAAGLRPRREPAQGETVEGQLRTKKKHALSLLFASCGAAEIAAVNWPSLSCLGFLNIQLLTNLWPAKWTSNCCSSLLSEHAPTEGYKFLYEHVAAIYKIGFAALHFWRRFEILSTDGCIVFFFWMRN